MAQFEDETHIQLHVDGKDGVSPEHLIFEAWDSNCLGVLFP
ncbi:MAG: hypothetical protein ACKONH_06910 [Planctomycetia bacterium]